MSFLEKFLAVDRRYIFIVVGIAVIIPFLVPLNLGVTESPPVKHVYDFIEAIPEGTDKPVLVSFDYDPSTQPELSPMAVAILTHCFRRDIPVIVTSLHPGGPGLALDVSSTVSEDMGAESVGNLFIKNYHLEPIISMILFKKPKRNSWLYR